MSFDLLSEPIRKYVRDKRWESLRDIQAAAISRILTTDCNYILASRTASGKTEAAFLPILSKLDFSDPGIPILYISPLIALINDQFNRIEELCKYLDVTVTKWHGEANRTQKERIIKTPSGVILITPESIEAMFVNKPFNVKHLFSNLKYVVIDEIHSFIGSDRGIQLKSLLSRLQELNTNPFNVIGLSATLADYQEAKRFTGNEENTKVLLDKTPKEINAVFRFFSSESEELPIDLLKDLYLETKDNKVLIFPNSRGRSEEVAVKLKKISERVNGHRNYFSHHSSIDREVREYVEYFAKTNVRQNFCISCTSTLELGIDIGTVDEVVQIDTTNSIASLIQRIGRSGRKEGQSSNLFLYATNKWSLLQSLACWLLYKEGFIDPPLITSRPYDILLHQALSITKGHSGIPKAALIAKLQNNFAFREIPVQAIEEIIDHLIQLDLFEKVHNELIIGIDGERVVNNKDFYTVFKSEENFKVINSGRTIGEVPFSIQIREDENIFLAAKMWKIKFVDEKYKKIEVISAIDGKRPIFFGGSMNVHPKIREKMLQILFSEENYEELEESSANEITNMRNEFSVFDIKNIETERPVLQAEGKLDFFSFSGTRINRTINYLVSLSGIKNEYDEQSSSFEINMDFEGFITIWHQLETTTSNLESELRRTLESNPAMLDFSKWGGYLPIKYQIELLKEKHFDFEGLGTLQKVKLIVNK